MAVAGVLKDARVVKVVAVKIVVDTEYRIKVLNKLLGNGLNSCRCKRSIKQCKVL